MRSYIKGFYFFQCRYNLVLFKMQSYCGGKLLKKFAEPTEFEIQIGNTIHDLEVNSDLKDLRGLSIVAANEVDVGDKKCIVLIVAVPMLNAFKKFQQKLVRELEKKLAGKHVVLIAQRRILPKEKKGQKRILSQKRPKSRTLTSVHTCILDDWVYQIIQDTGVHTGQCSALRSLLAQDPLLSLLLLGQDTSLSNYNNLLSCQFLFQLTNEFLLELFESIQHRNSYEQDDAFLVSNINLIGCYNRQSSEILKIRVNFKIMDGVSDLDLKFSWLSKLFQQLASTVGLHFE